MKTDSTNDYLNKIPNNLENIEQIALWGAYALENKHFLNLITVQTGLDSNNRPVFERLRQSQVQGLRDIDGTPYLIATIIVPLKTDYVTVKRFPWEQVNVIETGSIYASPAFLRPTT